MSGTIISDIKDQECTIRCNWCLKQFRYVTDQGRVHNRTACPDCGEVVHVPRNKLNKISPPINGAIPRYR